MKLTTIIVGKLETNCYLLRDSNHVLLIDPGAESDKILSHLKPGDQLEAILLTHGHWDHTGAIEDILRQYPVAVYMNYGDIDLLKENFDVEALSAGEHQFGTFKLTAYHTPGHSKGSMIFRCGPYLFTGDTLFLEDIGRTDLPGGSDNEMIASLDFISTLDPRLIVLPGHEGNSTIKHELQFNSHLKRSR